MRTTHLLSILAISSGIVAGGALLAPAIAQNASANTSSASAAGGSPDAPWLTIVEVVSRLEAAGYGQFDEIERERDHYEVKALDREGRRVEIEVHPVTAEVLRTEVKRDKR